MMKGRLGRHRGRLVAIGFVLLALLAPPPSATAAGCPPAPWTLTDVVSVPGVFAGTSWSPVVARRSACFGDARINFVARGGLLMGTVPGVVITPAFGRLIFLVSGRDVEGWDLQAWVPPDLPLGSDELTALDKSGTPGPEGWHDVWWRGSGHFNDPAAADCRPDDGTGTIDGKPVALTPAEAVDVCRDEFLIDALAWLSVPPTDAVEGSPPPPASVVAPVVGSLLGLGALVAMLCVPIRSRRLH